MRDVYYVVFNGTEPSLCFRTLSEAKSFMSVLEHRFSDLHIVLLSPAGDAEGT